MHVRKKETWGMGVNATQPPESYLNTYIISLSTPVLEEIIICRNALKIVPRL